MTNRPRILDNRQENAKLVDLLRESLRDADTFRLVSAYFSIYGYRLLERQLAGVDETRFLYGDPTSIDSVDPGYSEPKSFEVTERGLTPSHLLEQKGLAKRCLAWVEREGVRIRSMKRANFLHGKMYLADSARGATGVVGSSNFTERGLGGSTASNLELNLAVEDDETLRELREWFDTLWNDDDETEDVKAEVVAALNRLGDNYSPEAVYYKTLYELFRREIEAREAEDSPTYTTLHESQIWQALYGFQRDGAKTVIGKLRQHNGCILADGVGLGKTYTALAVIKYFELRNERVLVLCPAKLRQNWELYQIGRGNMHNPFQRDRFGYLLLAHTDLSREAGDSGGVDLSNVNWGDYDLIVIDESHNFRNSSGKRYRRLMDEAIKRGANTKVLMLSATPVNTSLEDLGGQIHLMTGERDDAFRESLSINSVHSVIDAAQREFEQWRQARGDRSKTTLLERLSGDFFRLLGGVSIARSRKHIENHYKSELKEIGGFPKKEKPRNIYPKTDTKGELSYKDLADRINNLNLAVYAPSHYALSEMNIERQRETNLIGMMRTNFLKRLESSPCSLELTLARTIAKIDEKLNRIASYEAGELPKNATVEMDDPEEEDPEDEEILDSRGSGSYRLADLNLERWKQDLIRDRRTLSAARDSVSVVTPERDGKLLRLMEDIRDKANAPRYGGASRKLLVFTTFADTAEYLYGNLKGLAANLNIRMAMVTGDGASVESGGIDFNEALSNFSPIARGRDDVGGDEIDLLIATDCISEGQNLQDCDTVINYDIHWNPVRIIQRFGRIDRIGSRRKSVRMINYWPTRDLDEYLKLKSRVESRMVLADAAATGDDNPFDPGAAEQEATFRDAQLRRLLDDIPDLDDLEDTPSLGDFTFDDFISQLLRYLRANKDELEAMPGGAYAVVSSNAAMPSGVIYCLKQANASEDPNASYASPRHPFYLVYVGDDKSILIGCRSMRDTLDVFSDAAAGKPQPDNALCDMFDSDTDNGGDMTHYSKLLEAAVEDIGRKNAGTRRKDRKRRGGSRDAARPTPARGLEDFELVTWLAIIGGR